MINNLVMTKKKQISYDMCEACGSLWLDAGELDKMAFQVEGSIEYCSTDAAEGIREPQKQCPRCEQTTLDKVNFVGYGDIVLDRCDNCGGFWLDGGELDLINRELEQIMPVAGKGFSEFVNKVHLPFWHKRIRRRSSDVDFEVEALPIRHAELKSETDFACPACGQNLNTYEVYGIEVEGCAACKGVWLDKDELRTLKDRSAKESGVSLWWLDDELEAIEKAHAAPSRRACPKCEDARLVSAGFGHDSIYVDWCPGCHGVWLDREEFGRINQYLRDRLAEMSSDELRKAVYQEIKEVWEGPEDRVSEILDAKAAISTLVSATIFEHPVLRKLLSGLSDVAHTLGM